MAAKTKKGKRISPKTGLPVRKYTKRARKTTKYTGYSVAERLFGPDPPQKKRTKQAKSEESVKGAPTSFEYTTPSSGTAIHGYLDPFGWESARRTCATTLERSKLDSRTYDSVDAAPAQLTPATIPWSQQLGTLFGRVEELESQIEASKQETVRLNRLLMDTRNERDTLLESKGLRVEKYEKYEKYEKNKL